MEAFALLMLKSVIWITGFALVFLLFLRNERFFYLNRIYLLAGILSSFILPFVSIHYTVVLPVIPVIQAGSEAGGKILSPDNSLVPLFKSVLIIIYGLGVLFVLTLILRQGLLIFRSIKRSEIRRMEQVKLIITPEYTSAFSFFSYVFVNPSVTDIETREIMNHELVHVRQKHWFDLVLVEMLCIIQWFNPVVWIYIRFIRQNHEYLADEVALQRTSDPAVYRAALLNQIVGAPVVSLVNSFNYSLNKKRFNMMKNIVRSPYRKMKVLIILPVFAIVLYAFAKPDYKYNYTEQNSGDKPSSVSLQQHEVKGTVVEKSGSSLPGAIITLMGTTIGTITDDNGAFLIRDVPDNGALVVIFTGYKSKVVKPDFKAPMKIEMVIDTVKYSDINISTPPPPPPPPPSVTSIFLGDGPQPIFFVEGEIKSPAEVDKIDPNAIETITVLKDKDASDKYGTKGKNGAVEITMKKVIKGSSVQLPGVPPPPPPPPPPASGIKQEDEKDPPISIDGAKEKNPEALPEFIGGKDAMAAWITSNLKYPGEAFKNKITGKVQVSFMVTASGKVRNAVVAKPVSPLLDAEAVRVVSNMPEWNPGTQGGKHVPVQMMVPVEFKLN